MRLLHTADWHAGRVLRGMDRTPEIRAALQEMLQVAVSERVDAVLVAGDLFDSPNPSADAENAVYEFFLRLGEHNIPSVVIAGNHDSPRRLDSVAGLLGGVGATVLGEVKSSLNAVTLDLEVGRLIVGAFPFLSERRLVKAADLVDSTLDTGAWKQKFREGMGFFMNRLEAGFRADAVNVMMLHTALDGGELSGSEFTFHVSNSYCVDPGAMPSTAQYVALGHLHKPQQLRDGPPVVYSGSAIQLDFGEAGEQKRVVIVEAQPGRRARLHEVGLQSGKTLKNVRVDVDTLERRLEEYRAFDGWLKVTVKLDHALPGLKDRVLKVLPNVLAVEVELSDGAVAFEGAKPEAPVLEPLEAFKRFYQEARQKDAPEELLRAFAELEAEVNGEERETATT
jgi:DNA repair protein SbcD/Mre11